MMEETERLYWMIPEKVLTRSFKIEITEKTKMSLHQIWTTLPF